MRGEKEKEVPRLSTFASLKHTGTVQCTCTYQQVRTVGGTSGSRAALDKESSTSTGTVLISGASGDICGKERNLSVCVSIYMYLYMIYLYKHT